MAVMVVENVRPRETIRPGTRVEGRSRSSGDGRDVVRRTFDCHVRYVHVDAAALSTVVDQDVNQMHRRGSRSYGQAFEQTPSHLH